MTSKQHKAIRQALATVVLTVNTLPKVLRPGVSELHVSQFIKSFLRKRGYNRLAFLSIVATGQNAYDFHHSPSRTRIRKGDAVVVDFGVRTAGTCTDLTRTFFIGSPTGRQRKMYAYVLRAQKLALRRIRPGAASGHVDAGARDFLRRKGLARAFRHTTGHGVGFRIHQRPRIAPFSREKLQVGQVITVEPGIYLKGWGGIRIEDMVHITTRGHRVLTGHIPSDIQSMIVPV